MKDGLDKRTMFSSTKFPSKSNGGRKSKHPYLKKGFNSTPKPPKKDAN